MEGMSAGVKTEMGSPRTVVPYFRSIVRKRRRSFNLCARTKPETDSKSQKRSVAGAAGGAGRGHLVHYEGGLVQQEDLLSLP